MKKVFIVHGHDSSPNQHWFSWLKKQVESIDILCEIVNLQHPKQPEHHLWIQDLKQQISPINDDVIIVAHSLGCLASLDFLSTVLHGGKLNALFLVAGFNQKLSAQPELNFFVDQSQFDDALIRLQTKERFLFFSNNDPFVPAPQSICLGHLLNAQMIELRGAKHFLGQDGFSEFPQLWERVKVLLQSEKAKPILAPVV